MIDVGKRFLGESESFYEENVLSLFFIITPTAKKFNIWAEFCWKTSKG